jgi:hypothetical protein
LGHELAQLVKGSLFDLGKDRGRDDFKLVDNLSVSGLEIVDFFVVFEAIASALVDEGVGLREPVEPPNTGLNKLIKL